MPVKEYLVTVSYITHEKADTWETVVRTRSPELAIFVAGARFFEGFPQVARVYSVMANALRVGAHLLEG